MNAVAGSEGRLVTLRRFHRYRAKFVPAKLRSPARPRLVSADLISWIFRRRSAVESVQITVHRDRFDSQSSVFPRLTSNSDRVKTHPESRNERYVRRSIILPLVSLNQGLLGVLSELRYSPFRGKRQSRRNRHRRYNATDVIHVAVTLVRDDGTLNVARIVRHHGKRSFPTTHLPP